MGNACAQDSASCRAESAKTKKHQKPRMLHTTGLSVRPTLLPPSSSLTASGLAMAVSVILTNDDEAAPVNEITP